MISGITSSITSDMTSKRPSDVAQGNRHDIGHDVDMSTLKDWSLLIMITGSYMFDHVWNLFSLYFLPEKKGR